MPKRSSTAEGGIDVLVVSHEASRTGAPRVAVDVARTLQRSGSSVRSVLRWGGPIVEDFKHVARAEYEPWRRTRVALRRFRTTRPLAVRVEQAAARRVLARVTPSVVWANTVKAANYVRPAIRAGVPVVLHVHETEPMLSDTLRRYDLADLLPSVQLAACAPSVRAELAEATGVPEHEIELVCPVVGLEPYEPTMASSLSAPMIVGAVGTADARKGVDLFLDVASELHRSRPDIAFEWIGKIEDRTVTDQVRQRGLEDAVHFLGPVADPVSQIVRFTIFVLTSRRDPYPLVVLEAMSRGLPIVAFDVDSVRAQLGETGVLIAPERPDLMAQAIEQLLDDPERRVRLGRSALRRAAQICDPDRFQQHVLAAIDRAVERN